MIRLQAPSNPMQQKRNRAYRRWFGGVRIPLPLSELTSIADDLQLSVAKSQPTFNYVLRAGISQARDRHSSRELITMERLQDPSQEYVMDKSVTQKTKNSLKWTCGQPQACHTVRRLSLL